MKKLILLICLFCSIFMPAFCADIDLSDTNRYYITDNYSTETHYIDKQSLCVLRYDPPYYIIQGDTVGKYYRDNGRIIRVTTKYYFDYNLKDIKYQNVQFTEYDINGNFLGSYPTSGIVSYLQEAEKDTSDYLTGWFFFFFCYNIPFSDVE